MERSWLSVFGLAGAVGLVAAAALYIGIVPGGATVTAASGCENGTAVSKPADNPGLVSDCETLLEAKDTLRGTAPLNWSTGTPITRWRGVRISGSPQRVTSLRLGGARLTGSIPAGLAELSELALIDLRSNELRGTIPAGLGTLKRLWILRLSNNRLSGTIPAGLATLTMLELSGNSFTGCVPAKLLRVRYNDLERLSLPTCGTGTPEPTETPTPTATATATATVTATYTLTATTPENGTLAVAPAAASYASGTTVTVTATAATGYEQTAWGGSCAATPATSATCTLTMDADKTVSATFGKAGPGIAQAPAPALLTVTTGKAGEVLLEWSVASAPAGLTGWQYRYQAIGRTDELKPKAGSWGAWTNVPGGAAARSHRVTGLGRAIHYFEVRAVAGSRTGKASASAEGRPAYIGADGIPQMLPGDIIEGGRTWRLHAGRTVFDVPAGTRLVAQGVAIDAGLITVSFRDLATGAVQVVDIDRAEGVGRYPPPAGQGDALTGGSGDPDRDVDAIFDRIMASARLVPVK